MTFRRRQKYNDILFRSQTRITIIIIYLTLQPPVEVETYIEDYDATDDGNICPQFDISAGEPMGDEDCLNLNVYTPKIDKKKRAVMVYIHGGAFIMGGGASYFFGPNYLLEQVSIKLLEK